MSVEYVAEMGAFNRVSARFGTDVNIRSPLGMLMYALYTYIDTLSRELDIKDSDRESIIYIARNLRDPSHKNPAALVYGFMALSEGQISKQRLARVTNHLQFGVRVSDRKSVV